MLGAVSNNQRRYVYINFDLVKATSYEHVNEEKLEVQLYRLPELRERFPKQSHIFGAQDPTQGPFIITHLSESWSKPLKYYISLGLTAATMMAGNTSL